VSKHKDLFQTQENIYRKKMFKTAYWNEDLSCMYVFEWFKIFGGGCVDLDPRRGRLSTTQNPETVEKNLNQWLETIG
jgi:hypothetical protein